MEISIIVIGDELLIGQVTDTNSGEIARQIASASWTVRQIFTVADRADDIRRAISEAFVLTPVVVTTGGLGPTKDDITKTTLCEIFGGEMKLDEPTLENVRDVVARRGFKINPLTAAQAVVPTSCRVIQNRVGTAPIMWFDSAEGVLVAMPGVPFETREMFAAAVFPQLLDRFPQKEFVAHRTVIVTGITESDLSARLEPFESSLPLWAHLAYLPRPGVIRLRLDGVMTDKEKLESELDRLSQLLADECNDLLLTVGDIPLPELLIRELSPRNLSFSTAESCTGGNIAAAIVSIPGSSAVLRGGVVAYSNDVKQSILGVEAATLEANGAVSIPVVEQMALGACRATGSDIAVATSGIAGPSGAVEGKPVGTVCIACACRGEVVSNTYHFPGNRGRVIDRAVMTALILAVQTIRRLYPANY